MVTSSRAQLAASLAALSITACGDALVAGDDLDRPLFSFHGTLAPAVDTSLALGVLWVSPNEQEPAVTWAAQAVVATVGSNGDFSADVLELPGEAPILPLGSEAASGVRASLAWGEIVLYEDRDDDGSFSAGALAGGSLIALPDVYRGSAGSQVLVFVTETSARASTLPVFGDVLSRTGYAIARVDCGGPLPKVLPADPSEVSLTTTSPSETFPAQRRCLRSHPEP